MGRDGPRGGWRSGERGCLGLVFEVTVEDGGPTAHVEELISPYESTSAADVPPRRYAVRVTGSDALSLLADDEPLAVDTNAWRILAMLQWHLNQAVVVSSADRFVLLHAAAAVRDGVTVVLAAAMEQGKTTTVAGLVRAGYRYLTDETVALVPGSLDVRAYPKPLTLDRGSWHLFPELRVAPIGPADTSWFVPATRIRGDAQADAAGRPRLIILPAYRNGAETQSRLVPPPQALLELAKATFRFTDHPRRNLEELANLARLTPTYALDIGDLDAAVAEIDRLAARVTARD